MRLDVPPPIHNEKQTQLLVSVRTAEEVDNAITGGADWIDLKEPQAGALGPVSYNAAKEIIASVNNRVPISAALGELIDWDVSAKGLLTELSEIQVFKLGLAKCTELAQWQSRWQKTAIQLKHTGRELAAVAYADWQFAKSPSPLEIIELAEAVGAQFFLLDTYDKTVGSIFHHLSINDIKQTLLAAKQAKLHTVLAGSLTLADLGELKTTEIDTIGVRGGVCGGSRTATLCPNLVAEFHAGLR